MHKKSLWARGCARYDFSCAESKLGPVVTAAHPTIALIRDATANHSESFAAQMAQSSLEAAVDIWLKRVARRRLTAAQRIRLLRAVERGTAAETKDVQLTRAALLRAAGYDEGPAAAAASAAGATYTEIAAVLGISQQAASERFRRYVAALDNRPRGNLS